MDWICQQAPGFLLPRWYNVLAWVTAFAIITNTLATKSFVLFSAHPVFMSLACVGFMSEVRSGLGWRGDRCCDWRCHSDSACVLQAIASYRQVNEKTTQRRRHRILNLGAARAFIPARYRQRLRQARAQSQACLRSITRAIGWVGRQFS